VTPSTHSRPRRLFAEDVLADEIIVSASEAHHAMNVLRLGPGDAVELFDGRGSRARGRIVRARRGELTVAVEGRAPRVPPPTPAVHLAFAVPKSKRVDWLLEKATELAVASLQPVRFERSVAGGKPNRWRTHCISAAKQCGLDYLPQLGDLIALAEYLLAVPDGVKLLGDTGVESSSVPAALVADQPICLLVGPEGGLTDHERACVLDAGFQPTRLGSTTLRIETAAVSLVAACVAWSDS
jgi:16S rRNA (uracil1498-N3)-methyltransferase